MVVKSENSLRIVEALDVLVGLREICSSIHMLQHVHVFGDIFDPFVLRKLNHVNFQLTRNILLIIT